MQKNVKTSAALRVRVWLWNASNSAKLHASWCTSCVDTSLRAALISAAPVAFERLQNHLFARTQGGSTGAKMFIWVILWILRLKGTAKVCGGPSVAWERPAERRDQSSYRPVGDIFNREVPLRAKCHATKRLPVLAFCEATLTSCFFSLVTQTINHQLQDFDFSNDQ